MATGRLGGSGACWVPLFAAIATALVAVTASAQQSSSYRKTINPPNAPVQEAPPAAKKALAKEAAVKPPATAEVTRTRFIVGLERRDGFKVTALTNPNRVTIDLPQMKLDLPSLPGNAPVGVVKSFRHGLSAPGKARIVIDVTGPVVIERSTIEKSPDGKSDRLVLDIVVAPPEMALPVPQPAVRRAGRDCKRIIVIDPGHGGHDDGAKKFGTVEKDVVLSFSLKLREKLNATGRYKVLMTRDTDVFVPLEARREFAERNVAQLFIAIHADYAARPSARGATIYSLRPHVADALRRSAESMLSVKEMAPIFKARELALAENVDDGVLHDILTDLARRDVELTKERTGVLARSVIGFMGSQNLMENPDRTAAFVVLRSAKVPSILLELGYLTNEEDAQQLRSDKWRDKISGSLVTAIHEYFKHDAALRSNDASVLDVDGSC